MVIGGLYRGAKRTSGEASGGGTDALIDAGTDFEALHVERDDIVANDSDGSWGTVASLGYTSTPEVKDVLNLQDGWHDGETNTCEDGDAYTIFARGGRGINIHNGKSTLVLGSILAGLDYGVYIHPCLDVNGSNETHRAQVIGVKGDNISHYGVYVGQNVYQAQVVAVSQPDPDKALQDEGDGTLVLTHRLARLPATVGIGWEAEQVFHPQHRWLGWKIDDQHVLRVEDGGLLDASIRGQAGCGAVTRYAVGSGHDDQALGAAFGIPPQADGFIGIYYDTGPTGGFYLVTRADSAWQIVLLS
jgi:hypothetical protein